MIAFINSFGWDSIAGLLTWNAPPFQFVSEKILSEKIQDKDVGVLSKMRWAGRAGQVCFVRFWNSHSQGDLALLQKIFLSANYSQSISSSTLQLQTLIQSMDLRYINMKDKHVAKY